MPGIIDLPKFNYEDLEEIFAEWTGFIWNLLATQVVTYIRTRPYAIVFINYSIQVFLIRMIIKFRITKESEEEEDSIKRPLQNV